MKVQFHRVRDGATIIYRNQSYTVLRNRMLRSVAFQPDVQISGEPFKMDNIWRIWDSQGSSTAISPDEEVEVVEMTYRPINEKEAKYYIK